MNMPYIRLELEHFKEAVTRAIVDHNNEIGEMVTKEVEKVITEEWVQENIKAKVKELIKKAIDKITDDYELEKILSDMIISSVKKSITTKKDEKD